MAKEKEFDVDSEELLEEEQTEEEQPEPQFQDEEEDSFEIISEDEAEEGDLESEEQQQQKEYREQLDALQQQIQQMQQQRQEQETTSAQDQKMDQLTQILKEMRSEKNQSQSSQNQNQQNVDWKKKRSEWQENIWADPLSTLDDYTQNTVGPVVNQLHGEVSRLKKQLARQNAMNNPRYKEIMDRYSEEVEEYAKNFEGDERAYEKAASFVGMNHFDDLLTEKAKEMAEQQAEQQKEEKRGNQSYSGVTEQPNPTRKRKKNKIVLKPHEKKEFDRQFSLSVFDNKREFYNRVWLPRKQRANS